LFDGKIYPCPYYLVLCALNEMSPLEGEYIDLTDESISVEQKKETIRRFSSQPHNFASCWRCCGLTDRSARYPAAEQIPGSMKVL
jgi:hypothetical protein